MQQNVAVGACLQFAMQALGGPVVEQDSQPAIQTSVTQVVAGNGDRVALIVINPSANDCYIHFDPAVSTTNGILLSAKGGNVAMDVTRDFTLPSRQWWGIGNGGVATLTVIEMFRFSLEQAPNP